MPTEEFTFDSSGSRLEFSVRHLVFSRTTGRFARFAGVLHLDRAEPVRSSVSAEIEAASIDTRDRPRDDQLRALLEATQFPTLRFVSKSIEPVGARRYVVHGELTIRDVTRAVALAVEDAGEPGGPPRYRARATLDRKDFGLKWGQLLETGGVLVGDKIDVTLAVAAGKRT